MGAPGEFDMYKGAMGPNMNTSLGDGIQRWVCFK